MTGIVGGGLGPPRSWPVVPPPQPDESLSSWLARIGGEYGLNGQDLFEPGWRAEYHTDVNLDGNPPESLVRWLAQKTGHRPRRIRAMTLSGYVPFLLDGLTPTATPLTSYVSRFRLMSRLGEPIVAIEAVPWMDTNWGMMWGCAACLAADAVPYRRRRWLLPWMLTCPSHGRFLEKILFASNGRWVVIESQLFGRAPLETELLRLDRMTHQAVTRGEVDTANGRILGGVWIRLLRAVIEELARLPSDATPRGRGIAELWADLDVGLPTANMPTGPYESLSPKLKLRLMRGAALAVERSYSLLTDWMEGNGPAMLDREADALRQSWSRW